MANRYVCKHIMLGRKPRANKEDDFKTAFLKLFDKGDDPLVGENFPSEELDFPNIEKVIIDPIAIEYYPEGNDIVLRNIKAVTFEQKKHNLYVKIEK